mgnify:CR=1 FL=1
MILVLLKDLHITPQKVKMGPGCSFPIFHTIPIDWAMNADTLLITRVIVE